MNLLNLWTSRTNEKRVYVNSSDLKSAECNLYFFKNEKGQVDIKAFFKNRYEAQKYGNNVIDAALSIANLSREEEKEIEKLLK